MILKLRTSIGTWGYFEANEIHVETFVKYSTIKDNDNKCYLRGVFTEGLDKDQAKLATENYLKKLEVSVITLVIEDKYITVVSDFPGYLLNNDGKTVDRIN